MVFVRSTVPARVILIYGENGLLTEHLSTVNEVPVVGVAAFYSPVSLCRSRTQVSINYFRFIYNICWVL